MAALAALLVTPAVVRVVTAHGLYGHVRGDSPARRVPRLGGIPVWLATSAGIVVAVLGPGVNAAGAGPDRFFVGVLLAGSLMFAVGLLDDLYNLRPSAKLLAQCTAAVVAYACGFRIDGITFAGATLDTAALALPLTLLWIVGVTNAFNLIDGLDGLATGIGLVALCTTLAVALMLGNLEVAIACAALGGALLGFLRDATRTYGQTIVMVTHDPVAASYADRVVFLADGRVVDELSDPTADSVLARMARLDVPAPRAGE